MGSLFGACFAFLNLNQGRDGCIGAVVANGDLFYGLHNMLDEIILPTIEMAVEAMKKPHEAECECSFNSDVSDIRNGSKLKDMMKI